MARLVRRFFPGLELHASTQLVAHNLEGVLALKALGFRRVVLARELSLAEVTSIAQRCGARKVAADGRPELELEVFIHGALCYSLSGLCLFGAMEKGRSGNRGQCPYCCRVARCTSERSRLEVEVEKGKLTVHSPPQASTSTYPPPQASTSTYPFSMKDLRLGEDARKLVEAGVTSLKVEGRMKSPLYVASVTRYYRDILDGAKPRVTAADLETVFSRRTTRLYFDGRDTAESPVDPEAPGHRGAFVGTVKKVTRDRDGRAWLRFHAVRALEKHDGLQFEATGDDGRPLGLGIGEMRQAISRRPVFEVNAGVDVEILLPEEDGASAGRREASGSGLAERLKSGMRVYCSMSNAVKRMFPTPSFRPSDVAGGCALDVTVRLTKAGVTATGRPLIRTNAQAGGGIGDAALPMHTGRGASPMRPQEGLHLPLCTVSAERPLGAAKAPEKTAAAVSAAFSKLGGTPYRLGRLSVEDPERLFAPASLLNDLRRDLVAALDAARVHAREAKVAAVRDEGTDSGRIGDAPLPMDTDGAGSDPSGRAASPMPPRTPQSPLASTLKVRPGQAVPLGDWDEIVVAVNAETKEADLAFATGNGARAVRLALPVYTAEPAFNRLRSAVKRLVRAGFAKWECADLATLRMLTSVGVSDVTADWSLAAFNAPALAALAELGVRRFVASPENGRENLQFLAESGFSVEFLRQQATPLFISLTRPAPYADGDLVTFRRDGLWVTTRRTPRTFAPPAGAPTRLDLSWDPDDAD